MSIAHLELPPWRPLSQLGIWVLTGLRLLPCAQVSLKQAHLQPTATATGLVQSHAPSEEVVWAYLVQLTSGLRAVHSADLVCHRACLTPSKVRQSHVYRFCSRACRSGPASSADCLFGAACMWRCGY